MRMSIAGCCDKWDTEPKRRAMQKSQGRNDFPRGVEAKKKIISENKQVNNNNLQISVI